MASILGVFIVIAAMTCWAVAGIGYKYAMGSDGIEDRDPLSSISIRVTLITLFLFVMTLLIGDLDAIINMDSDIILTYWLFATLAAISSILGDTCYFYALRYLDSSRVYPLINAQILFTYPIAFFFFGESIPPILFLSGIMIIVGVMFVGNPDSKDRGMDNFNDQDKKIRYIKGISLGILTGFFWAMIYITMAVQNRLYYGPLESNFTHLIVYSIIIWMTVIIRPKHFPRIKSKKDKEKMRAYLITGIFGILSAGVGDWIYQIGVIENGVAISITIASTAPLVNQILAILILKEKFRKSLLLGVIIIVSANILIIF